MRKKVTVSKIKKGKYKYVCYFPDAGKRREKFFLTKTAAEDFATEKEDQLATIGNQIAPATPRELLAVQEWREVQARHPDLVEVSLSSIISDYLERFEERNSSILLSECVEKLLLDLQARNKSRRHQESTKSHLSQFCKEFDTWMMSDFTREQVKQYLIDKPTSPVTKLNHLRSLTSLFNKAVEIGALQSSPINKLNKELEKPIWEEPEVYTPSETAELLIHCPIRSLAAVALGFFCGVRRAELERIQWGDIDLTEATLSISAKNAKANKRRVIDIPLNCLQWLVPLSQRKGKLTGSPQQYRYDLQKMHRLAEIDTVANGLRHSFCSYHVALHESADKTALILGHSDARILFEHYQAIVRKAAAESFFKIAPESHADKEKVIQLPSSA